MPGVGGLELMRRVAKLRPKTQVYAIALTGYGSTADERDAFKAGFDAFLTKPVSIKRLRETLAHLLAP
jgi:two-component system CheB/CheR fusion protein